MAVTVPYQVQNTQAEQADGNILVTWTGAVGATAYNVERSADGVNFSIIATLGIVASYLDVLPGIATMFYYRVTSSNVSGLGTPSSAAQMVAAPPSEMSLYELRLRSQQTADRVNGNFVLPTEWNSFIRLAMYELYDLLITSYEDYYADQYVYINTDGTTQNYPIPDGCTNYLGGVYPNATGAPSKALYKIAGLDLGVNTSNNAWVTILKYDFIERNKYVYPNSTSTIYGVYNMRYRLMGNNLNFIPTPAGSQQVRLWYVPKLSSLLADTDCSTIGWSGWLRYVIARSAKYALDKEEGTDTSKLDQELLFLKTRIEQAASNRDAGVPDTISETRQDSNYSSGWGSGGGNAGW